MHIHTHILTYSHLSAVHAHVCSHPRLPLTLNVISHFRHRNLFLGCWVNVELNTQTDFSWSTPRSDGWHGQLFPLAPCVLCCAKSLQSCLTLCDPMDCSPPGSSAHGILQARILEWVAIPSSRASSWLRDRSRVSCISCVGRWVLYHWATWEAPWKCVDIKRKCHKSHRWLPLGR